MFYLTSVSFLGKVTLLTTWLEKLPAESQGFIMSYEFYINKRIYKYGILAANLHGKSTYVLHGNS